LARRSHACCPSLDSQLRQGLYSRKDGDTLEVSHSREVRVLRKASEERLGRACGIQSHHGLSIACRRSYFRHRHVSSRCVLIQVPTIRETKIFSSLTPLHSLLDTLAYHFRTNLTVARQQQWLFFLYRLHQTGILSTMRESHAWVKNLRAVSAWSITHV